MPAIQIEIDAAISQFQISEGELRAALATPVGRDLARRAIRVEAQAKRNATGSPPSPPGHGPGVVTGRLRGSITWRLSEDAHGPYADVGTAVFYAPFLELGTRNMLPRPFLVPALQAAY